MVGSLTPTATRNVSSAGISESYLPYTTPAPTCSIKPSDCARLSQATLLGGYSVCNTGSNGGNGNHTTMDCGQCTIFGANIQLLYFPVPTNTTRDICASTTNNPVYCPYGPATVDSEGETQCGYPPMNFTSTANSGKSTRLQSPLNFMLTVHIKGHMLSTMEQRSTPTAPTSATTLRPLLTNAARLARPMPKPL